MPTIQISDSLFRWDNQIEAWLFQSGPDPSKGSIIARSLTERAHEKEIHKRDYLPNPMVEMVNDIAKFSGGVIVEGVPDFPADNETPERIY